MRIVIDTNVVLSDLLWHGAPYTLIEHARSGRLTYVTSPALLAELAEIIARKKFYAILAKSHVNPEAMLENLRISLALLPGTTLAAPKRGGISG